MRIPEFLRLFFLSTCLVNSVKVDSANDFFFFSLTPKYFLFLPSSICHLVLASREIWLSSKAFNISVSGLCVPDQIVILSTHTVTVCPDHLQELR